MFLTVFPPFYAKILNRSRRSRQSLKKIDHDRINLSVTKNDLNSRDGDIQTDKGLYAMQVWPEK